MKKISLIALFIFVAMASVSFAEGYGVIDSNSGAGTDGKFEPVNAEDTADGVTAKMVVADAKKFFPSYIKAAGLPAAKAWYFKSYSTGRINAASWQAIDHLDATGVGITKPVNQAGEYYMYSFEVHYSRPVGSSKWTAVKSNSTITLGNGTPGRGSFHKMAADGTDLTQAEVNEQVQRDQEEYDRLHPEPVQDAEGHYKKE